MENAKMRAVVIGVGGHPDLTAEEPLGGPSRLRYHGHNNKIESHT